jgi:hypothetical protein
MKDNTASQLKAPCSDSTVFGPKLRPKRVRRGQNTEDCPPVREMPIFMRSPY